MSDAMALARRRTLIWMGGAAAIAVLLGATSMVPPRPPKARAEAGQLVLKDFAAHAKDVGLVSVTTAHETYRLVRQPAGGWTLPEKGDYPVRADRVDALVNALSAMRYERAMTRDERKFDRIGLGDPAHGGDGALMEVSDSHGVLAKLIVGYRDGKTYVREPDDLQAWAVSGIDANGMPPLQRGARWLDLEAVAVPADQIAEVEVRSGQSVYKLLPADAQGGSFKLAPPNAGRLAAGFALTLVSQALTRFSPTDVAPAGKVPVVEPASIHITRTKAGVEIIAHAWRSADKGWVTLTAGTKSGASADAVNQAAAINARTVGWAFQMTETDWRAFVTPLDALSMK